jgi:hypothetical protein
MKNILFNDFMLVQIYFSFIIYFLLLRKFVTNFMFIIKENIDENFLDQQMTHLDQVLSI